MQHQIGAQIFKDEEYRTTGYYKHTSQEYIFLCTLGKYDYDGLRADGSFSAEFEDIEFNFNTATPSKNKT